MAIKDFTNPNISEAINDLWEFFNNNPHCRLLRYEPIKNGLKAIYIEDAESERLKDMDVSKLSRDELELLYFELQANYEAVEEENYELKDVAVKAIEGMEQNRLLAENNERIASELINIIQKQLDPNFTMDDVPRFLS